jgi:hypothetical protein
MNEDGGMGFYRFPYLDPAEAERCQAGPRRPRFYLFLINSLAWKRESALGRPPVR